MANRKGLWIALGGCGVVVLAGVAFVGLIIFVVIRHLEVRPASSATAEQEYNLLRSRFAGRQALIELDGDNPEKIKVHRPPEQPSAVQPSTLHIFVWNQRESKVVRLDLPFWLLRLSPHSDSVNWNWSGGGFDFKDLQITVEDLERYGPGLVVDFEGRRGERLIVWSE